MQLTISTVDHAPDELYDQVPIVVELVREIPGDDRPDYWLGQVRTPIRWIQGNLERQITHLVLAARWEGTHIEPGANDLPVGIAFVTDASLLDSPRLDLAKCTYAAIGISTETSGDRPASKVSGILSGRIGRFFGMGN